MGVQLPQQLGGTIAASDSASLSLVNANGLPPGTEAWNSAVGSFFRLTISTASLVADEVLEVLNTVGSRWIIVDNAVTSEATNTAAGLMPAASRAGDPRTADAPLTDASVTIQPVTDVAGRYVLPAGTLTEARTLTLGITSVAAGQIVDVVVLVQPFNYVIKDNGGVTRATYLADTPAKNYQFFVNAGDWILSTFTFTGV